LDENLLKTTMGLPHGKPIIQLKT